MKRYIYILVILFLSLPCTLRGVERNVDIGCNSGSTNADSVVYRTILLASLHEKLVGDYRAEMYLKNRIYIRKKNRLIRFIPSMFKPRKGVREYIMETYSDVHYTAPKIYDQKIKASSGTIDKFRGNELQLLDFFHINIYSASLLHSKLISPLSTIAPKHYSYKIDSVIRNAEGVSYKILFTPRGKSYQLVEGYMIVSDEVWTVREMQFSGQSEYLRFDNRIEMGSIGSDDEFLPVKFDMNATFNFLGNVIDASFVTVFDYQSVELNESALERQKKKYKDHNYNLTESFNLQCDTSAYRTDSTYFAELRPFPLTTNEEKIYNDYYLRKDTSYVEEVPDKPDQEFWGEVGDMLISNYTIDIARIGSVKASPIINPFLLSYSGNNGFSYRQEFKYNRLFKGDRLLRVVPKVGYNFTNKEFYWSLNSDYYYWPRKRAGFHLKMGNGNRIYSSDVLNELKEMPDSIFDFDKIHLDYFRDFYVDFRHSVEITNGLTLNVGISSHRRSAVRKSEFVPVEDPDNGAGSTPSDPEIADKFRNTYISFAPRVRLVWTPGQYYYMSGDRKVNLHSKYPTFSLDWERAVKGVFNSTGKYERLEFDIQHQISLGMMRNLYYRAGGGAFTNQDQLYFVDFVNFARSNLPVGWNDDIGGVFQVLDRRWYNSSRKYLRANVTYEAPFLLLPRLRKYTRNVLNERLYLGVLTMPHLNPYFELGYGIGTHIFDLGVFVSNVNGKFSQVGFKFTFELFNR